MTELLTHHIAHARFEAARQLAGVGLSPALQRRHGHGFQLRALAHSQTAFDRLATAVTAACAPLNYQDLNALFDSAVDNRTLLEHFAKQLDGLALKQLSLETEPGTLTTRYLDPALHYGVSKTFFFEAAHQLPNVPAGHKCGRMHGHGFSVSIETKSDAAQAPLLESGESAIETAWAPLEKQLHWACLNDLPGLENPTSEHLAIWLWQRLERSLDDLILISVNETPSAGCVFDGHTMRIWKEQTFDSAVKLSHASADDPRRAIHGHTFGVRLHLQGVLDEVLGWVHDFGDVKHAFRPLFDSLDHRPLYSIEGLEHADDLTLARYIYRQMKPVLPKLCGVDVEHRPFCGAWLHEERR